MKSKKGVIFSQPGQPKSQTNNVCR